jgi:hypothetical protein
VPPPPPPPPPPKPIKEVDAAKSAVPKPAGAETSKSDVETETKPATKPDTVRKGGGGEPRTS